MRGLFSALVFAAAMALTALVLGIAAAPADAHRSGCHRWHSCPSDHATYRWRGLLCVAPYSDKRDASFRRRVGYEGRTYYCKR
jgi:hypothetical protein